MLFFGVKSLLNTSVHVQCVPNAMSAATCTLTIVCCNMTLRHCTLNLPAFDCAVTTVCPGPFVIVTCVPTHQSLLSYTRHRNDNCWSWGLLHFHLLLESS